MRVGERITFDRGFDAIWLCRANPDAPTALAFHRSEPRQGARSRRTRVSYETSCPRREALQEFFVGLRNRPACTTQGLDADMIRAGIPMGPKTRADRLVIAPRHDGIDEAVGTAIGKIRVAKAETLPILEVVRQRHVDREGRPRSGPCLGGGRFSPNHLLRAQRPAPFPG